MSEVVQVTKLSVKGIGCKPGVRIEGKPTPLCQIFGRAIEVKVGESKDGRVWSALLGRFGAINISTGEEFRSGKLFLPSGIHEMVESEVKSLKPGEFVTFAMEIRSVEASNPIGYSYQAVNLMESSIVSDELTEMRKTLNNGAQVPRQLASADVPQPKKGK